MKAIKVLTCSEGVITPSRRRFKVRKNFELVDKRNLSKEKIINMTLENHKKFIRYE